MEGIAAWHGYNSEAIVLLAAGVPRGGCRFTCSIVHVPTSIVLEVDREHTIDAIVWDFHAIWSGTSRS